MITIMKVIPRAQDVADLAHVSQSAVSRTFTPGASVSDHTRRKVLAAAQQLGYRPNALARSLITQQSRLVALVMCYLQNQLYPLVIEKFSQKLQQEGYHVLMFIADVDESVDGVLAEILQYQVEAIVLASVTLSPSLARSCAEVGVPVLQFNRVSEDAPACHGTSTVTSDNQTGGALAARLLLARGYRRLGFIAGLEASSTSRDRERGFMTELARQGHALACRDVGHYDFAQAQQAARRLYADGDGPDALFVAGDHMAIAVLDVLREELGLRVPEAVGVVGFDDVPQAAWGAYRLTTIRQQVEPMVDAAVRLLIARMRRTPPAPPLHMPNVQAQHVVVPCVLIERDTVRPAPDQNSSANNPHSRRRR